jgi:pimeloyl-ACP methyl ester carboxylesterase
LAALRWGVALAIALVGVGFVAWRSGDRTPLDEVAIAEARLGIDLESRRIGAGATTLHVVFAGPETGEPVLLLHGFPEVIGVYRADWAPVPLPEDGRPSLPVRFVAGGKDAFIPRAANRVTAEFLAPGAFVELPEASHWLLLEEPERIGELMVEFFSADARP